MATYIQIGSTVTVGSGGQAAIEFTSIPATFTDILVRVSLRMTDQVATSLTFNNSSSGYSERLLYGNGSSAASASASGSSLGWAYLANTTAHTANTFSNCDIYIPNYAGSTYKSVSSDSVYENNATGAEQYLNAGLWSNTAAITSVKLFPSSGTFVQYSTASLYGIKKD
jgi:hypothetical protein